MFIRTAAVLAAALVAGAIGVIDAGTASASQRHDADCDYHYFPVSFGDGVKVYCDDAAGPFQVTVRCVNLLQSWDMDGSIGYPGGRPSVGVCTTDLPLGTRIDAWSVDPA